METDEKEETETAPGSVKLRRGRPELPEDQDKKPQRIYGHQRGRPSKEAVAARTAATEARGQSSASAQGFHNVVLRRQDHQDPMLEQEHESEVDLEAEEFLGCKSKDQRTTQIDVDFSPLPNPSLVPEEHNELSSSMDNASSASNLQNDSKKHQLKPRSVMRFRFREVMEFPRIEAMLHVERSLQLFLQDEKTFDEDLHRHLGAIEASAKWWENARLVQNEWVRLTWRLIPRTMGCLPTQLISKSKGLCWDLDEGDHTRDIPLRWSPVFMDYLCRIASIVVFFNNPALVRVALQLAAICRTNDRRPWVFEDPSADLFITHFSDVARKNERGMSASEICSQVENALRRAGYIPSTTMMLFEKIIADAETVGEPIMGEEPPDIYYLKVKDLQVVARAAEYLYRSGYEELKDQLLQPQSEPNDDQLPDLIRRAHIAEILKVRRDPRFNRVNSLCNTTELPAEKPREVAKSDNKRPRSDSFPQQTLPARKKQRRPTPGVTTQEFADIEIVYPSRP